MTNPHRHSDALQEAGTRSGFISYRPDSISVQSSPWRSEGNTCAFTRLQLCTVIPLASGSSLMSRLTQPESSGNKSCFTPPLLY